MKRLTMTILVAAATVTFPVTASVSCTLVDGSTTDVGACRSVYGETRDDDGVGNRQTLGYFNSIYKWSDDDVSFETWSYEAVALRNSGGARLSAFTSVDLLGRSEAPMSVSTRLGTATYQGHSTGVYTLATSLGGNVGAVRSDVELTADFTGGELTGTFDGFSILPEAATGDGWQTIPASLTVKGSLTDFAGTAQMDADFVLPGPSTTTGGMNTGGTEWRVKRNQVIGLPPELPDLPEFAVKTLFVNDAAEAVGTVETISPLAAEQGTSAGLFSLSMSFGADLSNEGSTPEPIPTPEPILSETVSQIFDDADLYLSAETIIAANSSGNFSLNIVPASSTIPTSPSIDLTDLTLDDFNVNSDMNHNPIDYNGITTVNSRVFIDSDNYDYLNVLTFGGWMKYNYFEVKEVAGTLTGLDFTSTIVGAYSYGDATGTNPSQNQGSATWTGVAVGADVSYYEISRQRTVRVPDTDFFNADATLTVDFSGSLMTLDARFHNFVINDPVFSQLDPKRPINEINYEGVPIFDGGFSDALVFAAVVGQEQNAIKDINGAFFGPNHEEVGGNFVFTPTGNKNDRVIVGVFGAGRQMGGGEAASLALRE